jgi:hypothetical protein
MRTATALRTLSRLFWKIIKSLMKSSARSYNRTIKKITSFSLNPKMRKMIT